MRGKIQDIEKKIESLEKEKVSIEDAMYDPDYYSNGERVKTNAERLMEIKNRLEELFFKWSGLSEELEKIV